LNYTYKKISVIAAHPDDEILGCGGTIFKFSRLGCIIDVLILSEGITARYKNDKDSINKEELEALNDKCRKANKIIGTSSVTIKNFPDNRFDSIDLLKIVKTIEEFLDDKRPEVVFTHHRGDLNIDHQITNKAVVTACRPIAKWSPNILFSFDILSSTEWNFGYRENLFSPNVFINIENEIIKKIEAIKCYDSEISKFPFPRSIEAVEFQAKRYGAISNNYAAEGFELLMWRNLLS